MKVLNFGSLNYDYVYEMEHFVKPKETISSDGYSRNYGGKGLNQSIALAKAGMEVYHAGRVGYDGQALIDYLNNYNVRTDYLLKDDNNPTGHAIIQVCNGENCIILYGGSNQAIDIEQIDETLSNFTCEDVLLVQNEISSMDYLIKKAKEKKMKIVFNTAPMNSKIFSYPLELVDIFIVNEIEAAGLAGVETEDINEIVNVLNTKFSNKKIVLTVGENGSYFLENGNSVYVPARKVNAVDTTAAGDTFTGFFMYSYLKDSNSRKALELATKASSLTVQKQGAAKSIPTIKEVMEL